MGLSFKKLGDSIYHGINPFDGGQGWTSRRPTPPPNQVDKRSNLAKVANWANPVDNGRTFSQSQVQNKDSAIKQMTPLAKSIAKPFVESGDFFKQSAEIGIANLKGQGDWGYTENLRKQRDESFDQSGFLVKGATRIGHTAEQINPVMIMQKKIQDAQLDKEIELAQKEYSALNRYYQGEADAGRIKWSEVNGLTKAAKDKWFGLTDEKVKISTKRVADLGGYDSEGKEVSGLKAGLTAGGDFISLYTLGRNPLAGAGLKQAAVRQGVSVPVRALQEVGMSTALNTASTAMTGAGQGLTKEQMAQNLINSTVVNTGLMGAGYVKSLSGKVPDNANVPKPTVKAKAMSDLPTPSVQALNDHIALLERAKATTTNKNAIKGFDKAINEAIKLRAKENGFAPAPVTKPLSGAALQSNLSKTADLAHEAAHTGQIKNPLTGEWIDDPSLSGQGGYLSLGGNKKLTPEEYRMEIKNRLQEEYNQFALNKDQWRKDSNNPSAKAQFTENGRMFKEFLKNPDAFVDKYNLMPPEMLKPKVSLKTKPVPEAPAPVQNPVDSSLPNNTTQPANNLDINMERFKATRDPDAVKPQPAVIEQVGKLSDDQMVTQMVSDLGISESVARKIVANNNKAAIATNLYGSKDLIKSAKSPDAYANRVMNNANERGQAALRQGAQPKPKVTVKENPTVKIGADDVDTVTGEIMTPPPRTQAPNIKQFIDDLPDPKQTSRVDADAIIGEGTEWLRKGGQAIDDALKAKGDSFENFYRAIQQASDDVKAGIEPNVSPLHQRLYDTIKPTLDRLRQSAGVDTGETPYYLPRRMPGGEQIQMGNSLVDAIDAATMGSALKRTGKLAVEDSDMTPNSLASYATQTLSERYRHSMAVDDLMKAADERGTPITMKQASDAVDMQNQLANDLADAAKKGKDFTNDTVSDLNELGKMESLPQKVNNHEPGMLVQSPENMLKRARVWDEGFKQYDYAYGYGNEFVELFTQNNIPKEQFGDALRQSILKQMPNADVKAVDNAVNYAVRTMERQNLDPSAANGLAIRAFRNVAKDQMLTLGKTTEFTGNKMRKVVNEQINGRLLNDAHQQNFAQGLDSFITERINVSLRGLNVTSALFELGDIANIFSNYGLKNLKSTKAGLSKIDGDTLHFSHKYGEADASYLTPDMPQVKALDKIWKNPNTSIGSKMYQSYRTAENKLLVFRYIEQHKTELFFRTSEAFYKSDAGGNLSGGALVNRVMSDYKKTMLPHKLATANRIVGKMPNVLTQYANWGLQATKRLGRTISGGNKAGKFANMSKAERIARGFGTELLPKATAAALLGIPLMQILGMRDFTGATSGDFTGVDDEDKTNVDEVVKLLSLSPALSVAGNFYFANRRNEIADAKKAAGEDYGTERRPEDQPLEVAKQSAQMLIPFRSQYNKTKQVVDAMQQGYYENRDGRIQAEAPTGAEALQGAIFGKNYTQSLREYQDNPNIVSVLRGKAKPQDLITHNETVVNTIQNFGGDSPRDYHRPLSASITNPDGSIAAKGYSDMAKDAHTQAVNTYGKNSEQARTVMTDWIANGREYNRVTDNLRKDNPGAYQTWLETKDDNIITPEKWKVYDGNRDVFEFDKQRKTLEKRDLGRQIDPIYELPNEHVNEVLQERSAFTGDDMKLRQLLYKKDWYLKFKDAESKYMDSFDGVRDDSGKTKRVQDWNRMNKEVFAPDGLITKYPLVGQYQAEIDKFENYNSQERKDFTSAWYDKYGDTYTKQKEAYDNERWNLVNEMRKLEGVDPITFDEFKAKVEFPSDSADKYSGYGKSKKQNTGDGPESGRFSVSLKQAKTSDPRKAIVKIKQGSNYAPTSKPKVSIKKSLV